MSDCEEKPSPSRAGEDVVSLGEQLGRWASVRAKLRLTDPGLAQLLLDT